MMGLNLSGLCGADASACGYQPPGGAPPPPPPGPCASGEHAQPCLAGEAIDPATGCCGMPGSFLTYAEIAQSGSPFVTQIFDEVLSVLAGVAARIGRSYVCPHLPTIGRDVGSGLGGLIGSPLIITIGGTTLEVGFAIAGGIIGFEVGREAQARYCGP